MSRAVQLRLSNAMENVFSIRLHFVQSAALHRLVLCIWSSYERFQQADTWLALQIAVIIVADARNIPLLVVAVTSPVSHCDVHY
jgi:hypothetical protein